ncbi:MAG: hypothetical protein IT495_04365 [Gammaproteobacteria bacterium]|nr:hypothetical protein [Gammaproteobacteria bacterium]
MRQDIRTVVRVSLLAGLIAAGAGVAAQAADPCACWYRGFEDGTEFNWDNRRVAEHYQECARQGGTVTYDAGFKVAAASGERVCPFGVVKRPRPSEPSEPPL